MKYRVLILSLTIALALGLALSGGVSAHHSYVLTVEQLRAGLQKASSPAAKGFFLIDVRSPVRSMPKVSSPERIGISSSIKSKRAIEKSAQSSTSTSWFTANPAIEATLQPKRWPISAIGTSIMSTAA